jgi:hypothetical protein
MKNGHLATARDVRPGRRVSIELIARLSRLAFLWTIAVTQVSRGDPAQFTLNASQSSLKLSGRVASPLGGTVPMSPQVSGSDTASYSGTILSTFGPSDVQFPGGSIVAANNFAGPALTPDTQANYGMKAIILFSTANATVINLVFDLSSGDLAVAADGTFSANLGTSATVTSGIIDYTAPAPIGNGSSSLAGSTAANQATTFASISIVGQTQTLTIPINATIPFTAINPDDSTAVFTGKLVATRTLTTPPVAYWRGDLDTSWSTLKPTAATNWRTDASGANETLGLPGATTDVFFTTSDGGSNLGTVLGASYSIKGLTFTSDAVAPVAIGGANTLTLGADGIAIQTGAAAASINCPVALGASQTWSTGSANPLTVTGSLSLGSATLTKSGAGVVVLSGVQSFGNNAGVNVSGGTLRYSATANAASVGSGITVQVASDAQLELANSGAALSDGTHVADLSNDSQVAGGGLLVSGTNQRVGQIHGAGSVVVAAGGSLIANSVVQNALIVAGSSGSPGLLTIAPSDAAGNPLVDLEPAAGGVSGLISTGNLGTNGSFAAALSDATSILSVNDSNSSLGGQSLLQVATSALAPSAVPEPSALTLIALGLASLSVVGRTLRKPLFRPNPD